MMMLLLMLGLSGEDPFAGDWRPLLDYPTPAAFDLDFVSGTSPEHRTRIVVLHEGAEHDYSVSWATVECAARTISRTHRADYRFPEEEVGSEWLSGDPAPVGEAPGDESLWNAACLDQVDYDVSYPSVLAFVKSRRGESADADPDRP